MTPLIVRTARALGTTASGLFVVAGLLRDPLVVDHPVRSVDWYLAKSRVVVRVERPQTSPAAAPQASVQNVTTAPAAARP